MNSLIEKLVGIPSKQRWVLVLGIIAGIFIAFYMVSYSKSRQEMTDIVAKADQTKGVVQRLQMIEKRLPKVEEELEKLETRLKVSKSLLPEKKEIPALLTRISQLGSQAGLEFTNFQPGPEKRQNFFAEVPLSITVVGGYHELAKFLDHIRTLRRIVHVRELRLGGAQEEDGVLILRAVSTLVTYRFLSPKEEQEAALAAKRARRRR